MSSKPSNWPLILIAIAMTGAAISYHFTLDSRFVALEQKLDQNAIAMQQYQIAQETVVSSKSEALNTLSKEVDALQASLTPLGKVTQEQADSLADIRKQISSLNGLQEAQQDAQKKLADYAGQLDKIKHDIQLHQAQASAPAPSVPLPAPPSVPMQSSSSPAAPAASTEVPSTHASTADVKSAVSPRAESSAVDLRPAEITAVRENAVRALPVALPVTDSLSDNR